MEIKGWTKEEVQFLQLNYAAMTNKQLAESLGKALNNVQYIARSLHLVKQPHKVWTKEEDEFLIANYMTMTSLEIGKRLGRTTHSINARRDDLGLVRNPNWTKEEEQYLKENYQNKTYEEIGEVLNRTAQAVNAKCFDMGLYKKELPWSQSDMEFLRENYPYTCTKELAEILNRTPISVQIKANKMGVTKLPYYCDYHYFDCIDTEEKAYWLGFLTADGWISKKRNGTGKVVGVELQYGDIGHLYKLNSCLGGNYKVSDRWRKCSISNKKTETHNCILRIWSSTLHDALMNLGFTYSKSFDAHIPVLPKDLYRHFVRGYFDGNGTICLSRNRLNVSFCTAAVQIKDDLVSILEKENINIKDYSAPNKNNAVIYRPEATSQKDKMALLDYMYEDCHVYLDRKYKRYLKAKEYTELNRSLTS